MARVRCQLLLLVIIGNCHCRAALRPLFNGVSYVSAVRNSDATDKIEVCQSASKKKGPVNRKDPNFAVDSLAYGEFQDPKVCYFGDEVRSIE